MQIQIHHLPGLKEAVISLLGGCQKQIRVHRISIVKNSVGGNVDDSSIWSEHLELLFSRPLPNVYFSIAGSTVQLRDRLYLFLSCR